MQLAGELQRLLDEADARQLRALVADWWDAHDAKRWIARAVRLDLALVTARPELALPCLARRFAWIGTREELLFYRQRPDVEHSLVEARTIVDAWLAHWRPDHAWLRALQPPPMPLDSPVVEEYRTDRKGPLVIDDDERIGIAGEPGIVWDRSTGRVLVDDQLAAPIVDREWKLVDYTWGRFVIESVEHRVAIDHSDDEIIRGVKPLGHGLVLAVGDEIENDELYFALEPASGRTVWRGRGACLSHAVHGDIVYMAQARGIEARDVRTGQLRASWGCPLANELAVSSSGTIATRHGDVIRVWDLERASAWSPFEVFASETFVDVQWDASADYVLAIDLVSEANGKPIARLDLNGPRGWLEGGPPRDCQRLSGGTVAEILPWGTTLWVAATGEQLHEDTERTAGMRDRIAFDAHGRFHAIYKRNVLVVHHLIDGRTLFEHAWPDVRRDDASFRDPTLTFSADSRQLVIDFPDDGWILDLETGQLRAAGDDERAAVREPPPIAIAIRGGLLEYGDAVIPCDDSRAIVSPDGTRLASARAIYVVQAARAPADQK